jgi:hypothetical protein
MLPSRLAKCKAPYAPTLRKTSKPGECVSVDQLDATILGLIAQLKGIPTIKRYKCATVFFTTIVVKVTFIYKSLSHSRTPSKLKGHLKHLHPHTGRKYYTAIQIMATLLTVLSVKTSNATINQFCFVGSTHIGKDKIEEKPIRDLTDNARTMLLFAQRHWPDTITSNLWP